MKFVKLLPLSLLALSVTFTACNGDRAEEIKGGETVLELSSSISQTRVTTQDDGKTNYWDGNEEIGVSSSTLTAQNVLYKADQSGASTTFSTTTPIAVPMGDTAHDIKAYYPYVSGATAEASYDLATDNKQPVLYATGTVTHANPKLNLNFGHKLGKLRIVVDKAKSLTPNETVTSVTVADVLTKGTLTIENGTFTVDQNTKSDLTLNAKDNEYYTYLMPGETIKDKVITIVHGGKNYKATLTSTKTVEAGKYYLYTITLTNGSAQVSTGNGSIGNESEGDTGTVPGAPEAGTTPAPVTPATPVTATLSGTGYTNGTLSVPAAGGSYTLTLSGLEAGTTVSASATPAASWVSFTGDVTLRAIADQTFTVTVTANDQTVARETTITLTADGMNDLTFKIAQAKKEDTSTPPVVAEGDGTEANPYTVAQAIAKQDRSKAFVKGYIVGAANGSGDSMSLIEKSTTNIMIADSADETDTKKMMPVQLPKGAVRSALNLSDNPKMKGKLVLLEGTLEAYFSNPGLKNVANYKTL